MTIGVPHASNLTNSLPERVDDPAFPRQLKRIIRNLYDQLDYARGTSSGRSEYLRAPTNGTLQVPYGGTGTTSGVAGGIPYYSATTLMASTALLGRNNLVLGGGATGTPATMAHPATANQYALTGTTGTAAPVWTIATSSAATGTYALRDSTGGLAMATLTATAGIFSAGVTISGVLLAGAATFSGAMQAQAITMTTLTAGNTTLTGTLHAQGATFTAINVSTLNVSGAATMGAVSTATLTGTSATLTGTLRVGGGFTVAGASTLTSVGMATLTATAATFTGVINAASGLVVAGATTLGTVGAGVWQGTLIGTGYGGTGVTTFGGTYTLLYTTTANNLAAMVAVTDTTRRFARQVGDGAGNATLPVWDQVLDADLPATIVRTSRAITTTLPLAGGQTLAGDVPLTIEGLSTIGTANYLVGVNSAGTAWEYKATPMTIALGGTAGATASAARTNLGLAIGTDVQAYSATLAAVAGGTYAGDDSIVTVGTITTGVWNAGAITSSGGISGTTGDFSGTLTRRQDQNGATQIICRNDTSGTVASAQNAVSLGAFTQYLTSGAFSAGYSPSGLLAASSNCVFSSGASAGLRVMTLDATQLILGTNNTANITIASGGAVTFSGGISGTTGTFTGLVLTPLSATGGAGFRLPHGAAPTSPVDGDMWTTSAGGLFVRINGSTVGPLS